MFFKSREQKEIEALTKRLVRTILQNDQLKALISNAKKQWELEEFVQHGINYPIITDLVNSASHGVFIDLTLPDGSKMVFKRDPNLLSEDDRARIERIKRESSSELY